MCLHAQSSSTALSNLTWLRCCPCPELGITIEVPPTELFLGCCLSLLASLRAELTQQSRGLQESQPLCQPGTVLQLDIPWEILWCPLFSTQSLFKIWTPDSTQVSEVTLIANCEKRRENQTLEWLVLLITSNSGELSEVPSNINECCVHLQYNFFLERYFFLRHDFSCDIFSDELAPCSLLLEEPW